MVTPLWTQLLSSIGLESIEQSIQNGELKDNINAAINSTLGRTINTSGITFVVLVIIFIFGGEILRGFVFALLIGVTIGTYSSVFNATPISYDILMWQERRKAKKALK